jgi:Asp-tRNA(Asn)/Glu-tRNA(Gln) amidotransferase A subunit family amidase
VSPVDLTEAVLARIDALNPTLNAYITITAEAARAAARAAEFEIAAGNYRGALHGMPVAIKDLFATKGVRTTAGSKILADWVRLRCDCRGRLDRARYRQQLHEWRRPMPDNVPSTIPQP